MVADVDAFLYRLVQFAIREAVASRTLDEVLSAKNELGAELRAYVRERMAQTGIEVAELGVRDVILPGEIRELVNKVVEAERTAKANLIRRQEETAATRSLLNTAKLMEDNPLLLRLKELESIERLVEKVGRIDLHAGERRLRCAAHQACAPEGGREGVSNAATEPKGACGRPFTIRTLSNHTSESCGASSQRAGVAVSQRRNTFIVAWQLHSCVAGSATPYCLLSDVEPKAPLPSGYDQQVTPDVRAPCRSWPLVFLGRVGG
jgi:hypothetical protein